MRLSKLYIKIFLSFVGVLLVTLLIIFGLFRVTAQRHFVEQFHRNVETRIIIVQKFMEEYITPKQKSLEDETKLLQEAIDFLGKTHEVKIWATTEDGKLIVKSFKGSIPDIPVNYDHENNEVFKLHGKRRGKDQTEFHAVIPFRLNNNRKAYLHGSFPYERNPERALVAFTVGLIIIGTVIALLIIPVSRLISNPLKQLRMSALRIADGELGHRASLRSKDEIGDLGMAFNHMAGKVEEMVRGGKQLTANVSHELRSPLTRIRIAQELLSDSLPDETRAKCAQYLQSTLDEIEEMDELIGRILELSKFDLNRESFEREVFDLVEVLDDLTYRFGPVFDQKNLQVEIEFPGQARITGHKNSLQSALANLLDNAAKFTSENGRVKINAKVIGNNLKINISNEYEPLANEELNRIFHPFHRADKAGTSGTGLGLSITARVIEMHGGGIRAENSDDGFKICIILPLHVNQR